MSACTVFCERLKGTDVKHGVLPSHDDLIEQLHFSDEDQEAGRLLGTWDILQQRTACGFCQLVVAVIFENQGRNGNDAINIKQDQEIRILLFPGEQCFRLSYPSRLGIRLAFVAQKFQHVVGPDTGRPIFEPGIPTEQIKGWLKTCDEAHEACSLGIVDPKPDQADVDFRGLFNEDATSNFRVIDLELGCVKHVALDSQYVTLSYVWGDSPMFKLTTDNFEKLSTPGSLVAIRKDLPKTINDAILFMKAMGERYLWVDSLCLVQDNEEDVILGIKMMNSIYQGCYFTIVAGSGSNANAGLAGIVASTRHLERPPIIKEIAPGLSLTVLHSIDWHLRRSVYNQRGWTLQELVLPRRTIIFINGCIYFRCQEANWSEETWADKWTHWLDPDDSNTSRIPGSLDGFMPSFWAYQKLCEEYSRRKLRSDGDALRALSGISRPLAAGMKSDMVEGLPGYYLDHFLLFISSRGDMRRRSEFASFSWAGWEGRIMFTRENFVLYEGGIERSWKTTSILNYLKNNRVVEWKALDSTAHLKDLTFRPWGLNSLLLELMREHPNVFPDLEKDPKNEQVSFQWCHSHGSEGDIPCWDRDGLEEPIEETMQRAYRGFSIKALNLANGQAEFERLVRRIIDPREKLALQNWMAGRRGQAARSASQKSAIGPRPNFRHDEGAHYWHRPQCATSINALNADLNVKDHRVECGRLWVDEQAKLGNNPTIDSLNMPHFPPYTVLHFVTISFYLTLGVMTSHQDEGERASPFDRIQGIPLLGATNQLVGSLHPDNLDLLPSTGSVVECLIVSRCNTPTNGSALFALESTEPEKPQKLFWILYIVWNEGIAERRGVGQVLSEVLELPAAKPEVKLVLLG